MAGFFTLIITPSSFLSDERRKYTLACIRGASTFDVVTVTGVLFFGLVTTRALASRGTLHAATTSAIVTKGRAMRRVMADRRPLAPTGDRGRIGDRVAVRRRTAHRVARRAGLCPPRGPRPGARVRGPLTRREPPRRSLPAHA